MVMPLLLSCDNSNGTNHSEAEGDTIQLRYAKHLTMIDYGDYVKADLSNPWDTSHILQTYLLVPRDKELPTNLPNGTILRTPLTRSVVYTAAHNKLIDELGAVDAISGVCDAKYIHSSKIHDRIISGEILDCEGSRNPNIEKLMLIKPDAILLSAFENSNDHNKVAQIGIPIIDCTDYMEASPLARAEWMRFFGRLYGKDALADSMFDVTESAYLALKELAQKNTNRPMVLTEKLYGQVWHVPGANSTIGVLIEDAGGKNPFDMYKRTGSVPLSPEEALYKAQDADIWLIKYSDVTAPTISDLVKENEIYTKFKVYDTGEIYGCDSNNSDYFDDIAFHPQWILAEYIRLIHPEIVGKTDNYHYFSKLKP